MELIKKLFAYKTEEAYIRGQSLIAARWIGLLGQTVTVLVAYYGLGFEFPVMPCMAFIVLSGLINNYAMIHNHHRSLNPTTYLAYLSFDVIQLTVMLFLTGGLTNPFFVLLLAPILIGASLLPRLQMSILLSLGLACTLYLALFFTPLIWPRNSISKEQLHLIGETLALGITLVFASFYAWRISEENRNMQQANFAAKTALLKQKQLHALGAQAAAAVHELGSPLGTITIISKELKTELKDNPDVQDDIDILISQTERCRSILGNFGKSLKSDPTYQSGPLAAETLVQNISEGFLLDRPDIRFVIACEKTEMPIELPQYPELTHGLGVFIQNAIQFAKSRVDISISKQKRLSIVIEDDGPGFAPQILPRLGEPYTSTREHSGKNMGLGIFIAQTLLEETGARLSYDNRDSGGARVAIEWKI